MKTRRRRKAVVEQRPEIARADGPGAEPELLTVDEINARYPGQWVLLQVTAYERGWPSAGYVLAHEDTYEEMAAVRHAILDQIDFSKGPICAFEAYPMIRSGEELGRALDELWEQVKNDPDYDPFRWPRV